MTRRRILARTERHLAMPTSIWQQTNEATNVRDTTVSGGGGGDGARGDHIHFAADYVCVRAAVVLAIAERHVRMLGDWWTGIARDCGNG